MSGCGACQPMPHCSMQLGTSYRCAGPQVWAPAAHSMSSGTMAWHLQLGLPAALTCQCVVDALYARRAHPLQLLQPQLVAVHLHLRSRAAAAEGRASSMLVLSWYCHGTVMVLSWYCHGTVMVLSWYCHAARSTRQAGRQAGRQARQGSPRRSSWMPCRCWSPGPWSSPAAGPCTPVGAAAAAVRVAQSDAQAGCTGCASRLLQWTGCSQHISHAHAPCCRSQDSMGSWQHQHASSAWLQHHTLLQRLQASRLCLHPHHQQQRAAQRHQPPTSRFSGYLSSPR
jgi:hypothetical protein